MLAARSTLVVPVTMLRDRRAGEAHTALRVLTVASHHLNVEATRYINALTALVRTHDLDVNARKSPTSQQITTIAGWRASRGVVRHRPHEPRPCGWPSGSRRLRTSWPTTGQASPRLRTRADDVATAKPRAEAIWLGKRAVDLDREIAVNQGRVTGLVRGSRAAELLDKAPTCRRTHQQGDPPLPHLVSMGSRVRLTRSSGTARDGLDVLPLDGLFELVALVVAGRRDRRERAAPSEGRTMRNRLSTRPLAVLGRDVGDA